MNQTPGSRSDVGPEYRYKVIAYIAASLTQNSSIKDFVIYSKWKNFGEFDDLVLKLWFLEESLPYAYLVKIKHKSGKPVSTDKNLTKYEDSFKNILRNKNNIHILQDVPIANLKFWFFCNNNVEENTQSGTAPIYNFITFDRTNNIIVPFILSTGSCYQIRLSQAHASNEFFDKFHLLLNQPNVYEIGNHIAKICDIVESTDITDYVYEYYKEHQLFRCGLTKTNFEIELLQIHLKNYIVRPTKIVDVNEEQAYIWNKLTIDHQLTILDNVPDIRRILFGCFVHKINKLFNHDLKWDDCLYNEGKLDDATVRKTKEFLQNNSSRQWLYPPESIKSLIDYLWICNELPLILKIYHPLPILAKYKHLNKRFLIINESPTHSKEIAYSFSRVFTNAADIHPVSLRNELLQNIVISLQGRTPATVYDIIGSDQNCMKTLSTSEILHLIRKRKMYLEERCLDEAESTVFIILDQHLNTDKNSNTLEADDNDTIIINCKPEKREWYIKQIKDEPKYKQHSICCLRLVDRMLEFLEGDMHALRRYFIDNWGDYIYCVGRDQPIPIIGQRLDSKPQLYLPRYLQKAIIPNSVFKTQERRICLLSGDIDSLECDIKQQLIKEDVDYNAKIMLKNNQNVLIHDKIESTNGYWENFSHLDCPLFHVKVVDGFMELVNYKNCRNMSSILSYSKEALPEDIFYEQINSKLTVISGEPGIGKSSLLHSLSEATDGKNYALFCNLAHYRNDLTLDNATLFEDPADFIFKKFERVSTETLLHFIYKYHKENDRLTLFIDSFDEMLPMHKKSLLLFMKVIAKFNIRIIVASRLFFDTMLINNFEVQPVKVDTLKEVDYMRYFQSKGMVNMNLNEIPNEFLTSPLFLTFLWFFYREGSLNFTQISKFDLFKKIIMKKIERYYHKTKLRFDPEIEALTNDVLRMHREIALVVVFGKSLVIQHKLIKDYEKLLVRFKVLKMRLGIVKHFDGSYAVFLHQTFAEFLAAEWLCEKILDGDFDSSVQTIYEKILLEYDVNVKYLFDSMVCAKLKLYKAILEGNLDVVKQLIDEDETNLTQIDKCGRNALILAASYCYDKNYEILEAVVAKSHAYRVDFLKCDLLVNWNWLQYLDKLSKDVFLDEACNYNLPVTIATYLSFKNKTIISNHVSSAYRNKNLDVILVLLTTNTSLLSELFIPVTKDAIERGRLDIAYDLIVLKYNCDITDALERFSDASFIEEFVGTRTNSEFTALHLACMLGNRQSIDILSNNDASLHTKDIFGNIPVYYAIIHGIPRIYESDVIVENMKGKLENNLLHLACKFLKKRTVEYLLIDCGMPATERNSKGETPLHVIACINWQQIIENELRYISVEIATTSFGEETHKFNKILRGAQTRVKLKSTVTNILHKHVKNVIDILLSYGVDTTGEDKKGNTALHLAYKNNNKIVLEYLIEKFEELAFIKDANGLTVFEVAKRDRKIDIMNYIEQHTSEIAQDKSTVADISLNGNEEVFIKRELKYTAEQGRTFLHTAAINGRSDIILLLLEKGFPIDVRDDEGLTPLHFVKSARDMQLLLGRLNNMEEAFPESNNGETPLYTACLSGHVDVVRFLLSRNTKLVQIRNKYGQTPLHLSAMANSIEIAVILLNMGANVNDIDSNKATALHLVVPKGNISFVEYLLKNNANICLQDNFGNTVLHLACRSGNSKLAERFMKESPEIRFVCNTDGYKAFDIALIEGKYDLVDLFIKNFSSRKELIISNSILCKIVKAGYSETLKILLNRGIIRKCDLEYRDDEGNSLLHHTSSKNHPSTMYLLLENGLQPNCSNCNGETPLHLVQSAKCAKILLSKYDSGSMIHAKTKFGETPLHKASCVNVDVVRILLNAKADISCKDSFGWTPLHLAAWANKLDIVQELLRNGANVNERNNYSATALHIAAAKNLPLVKILLNSGANINAVNKCELILQRNSHVQEKHSKDELVEGDKNQTVLDIACVHGKRDIIEYLFRSHKAVKTFSVSKATLNEVISSGNLWCLKMLFNQQVLPKNYFEDKSINRYKYLDMAVASGFEDVVSFLLEKDAYLNENSDNIAGVVLFAALKDHDDIIATLLSKNQLPHKNEAAVLSFSIIRNNIELIKILINRNPDLKKEADIVHIALQYASPPILDMLVTDETDFNIKNEDGYSALDHTLLSTNDSRITYLLRTYPRLKQCTVSKDGFFALVEDGKLMALQILFEERNLAKSSDGSQLFLETQFLSGKPETITTYSASNTTYVHNYLDLKNEFGNTALHLAVIENRIDIVQLLIEKGSSPNMMNNVSQTSLHLAVIENNVDIIRVLLERGANVNAPDSEFTTALHIAASRNLLPVLETLLDYEPNIESVDKDGDTALHDAVMENHENAVRILLERGANVNATNNDLQTVLHIASSKNLSSITKILLDHNAKIESLDMDGVTPLHIAIAKQYVDIVQILLERGADVNVACTDFTKALRIAAEGNLLPMLEMLLDYNSMFQSVDKNDITNLQNTIRILLNANANESNNDSEISLNIAASQNLLSILEVLSNCNSNIDLQDVDGNTTANFEVIKDNTNIIQVLLQKCTEVNTIFTHFDTSSVEHNAEINLEDVSGQTAIYFAVVVHDAEIMQLLLEKGANVNATDNNLRTPLHFAVAQDMLSLVKMLLDYHADTNLADVCGYTALHFAMYKGNINMVQLLIENGSNVNAPANDLLTTLHIAASINLQSIVEVLLDHNADIQLPGPNGLTTLHLTVEKNNIDMVRVLLERGANVNATAIIFGTALHMAASKNMPSILKLLLNFNANSQLTDKHGNTPLHLAYLKGNILIIELLTNCSAKSISTRNLEGHTPFEFACMYGTNDALQTLFKHIPLVKTENISTHALHGIVERGRLTTLKLVFNENVINKDDLEKNGKFGRSLLHTATTNDHVDIVRFLLDEGAKVNPLDIHGFTPLHLARSVDIAKCLLTKCDAHKKSQSGRTPLHTSSLNGHVDVIQLLLSAGAALTIRDSCGWTPLLLAAYKNQDSCVEILLNSGADVNETNNCNEAALHLAVQNGNMTLVNILLENGADVHIKDWNGNTVLHSMLNMYRWHSWFVKSPLYSCELPVNNVTDLIHILLQHKIDSSQTNGDQEQVIEIVKNLKLEKLPKLEWVETSTSTS